MITLRVILDASLYGNDKSIFVQRAKKLNLIRIEIQTNTVMKHLTEDTLGGKEQLQRYCKVGISGPHYSKTQGHMQWLAIVVREQATFPTEMRCL